MLKIILPILMLAGAVFFGKYLIDTGPKAKKKPFVERLPVVEIQKLKSRNYTVSLKASGVVRAGIQTNLVAEVSGKVLKISDKFLEGSYFKKGEILLQIDASNYKNSLAISQSDVAANQATLSQLIEEEKSTKRSYYLAQKNLKLGRKELSRLHNLWKKKLIARSAIDVEEQKINQLQQRLEETQGKLNTFSSRKLAIKAKTNAALTRQKQERLNLSRAVIKAPYAGRVLQRNVDIDQFVGTGTSLGKIYATRYVYVDLPLSLNQYELLGITDSFENTNNGKNSGIKNLPKVSFSSTNSRNKSLWEGQVVRTSAALDVDSRQIKVIAKIDKPFIVKQRNKKSTPNNEYWASSMPLKIGQYLNAKIEGKTFHNVYVLPSSVVRQNKEILLLQQGKVHIVPIDVIFNTSTSTILRTEELIEGKQLITTPMSQAIEGSRVITLEEKIKKNKQKDKMRKKKQHGVDVNSVGVNNVTQFLRLSPTLIPS